MNRTTNTVGSGAKGTSTLMRARFGPGMLLQHDDLEQLNSYTRDLNRLMFQSLFGCGVICGLKVTVPKEKTCGKVMVTVGAGVALGCSGDPVYVPKDQTFALDENCDPSLKGPLWVVLCGTVKCCEPRTAMCSSDDDDALSACTRERDGYEIRVVRTRPECCCGCLDPRRPTHRLKTTTASASRRTCPVIKTTTRESADATAIKAAMGTASASFLPAWI